MTSLLLLLVSIAKCMTETIHPCVDGYIDEAVNPHMKNIRFPSRIGPFVYLFRDSVYYLFNIDAGIFTQDSEIYNEWQKRNGQWVNVKKGINAAWGEQRSNGYALVISKDAETWVLNDTNKSLIEEKETSGMFESLPENKDINDVIVSIQAALVLKPNPNEFSDKNTSTNLAIKNLRKISPEDNAYFTSYEFTDITEFSTITLFFTNDSAFICFNDEDDVDTRICIWHDDVLDENTGEFSSNKIYKINKFTQTVSNYVTRSFDVLNSIIAAFEMETSFFLLNSTHHCNLSRQSLLGEKDYKERYCIPKMNKILFKCEFKEERSDKGYSTALIVIYMVIFIVTLIIYSYICYTVGSFKGAEFQQFSDDERNN